MDNTRSVQMTAEERSEFLGTGGTGVVSFPQGDEEPPYSFPVSYGYDEIDDEFYLRLAFGPDTEKGGLGVDGSRVSLVVYDQTDDGWRSVVATGRLVEATEAAIDSDVVQAMQRIHIPLVDVFERHPRELNFRFFTLSVDGVSGRKEARSAD